MSHPLDPSNFRQFILEEPTQFAVGFENSKDAKAEGTFDKVVLSGMGGSALFGNLIITYLVDLAKRKGSDPLPFIINRTYSLPRESYKNALNIICSYSGNTEEALSSFTEAHEAGLACVGVASGGKLEELCKEWNVPFVKVPMPYPDFQPRMGTGYLVSGVLGVLINQGLIPDVREELLKEAEGFSAKLEEYEERGKVLSEKIKGKTPVVYASSLFSSLAMVWKIKINENAKTPAFYNFFPELNHNEMIGYTNPQAKFFVILLKDEKDDPRNLRRYQATADLLKGKGVEVETITLEGDSVFEKIFLSILLADFTSYNLALSYGVNPTPVALVEELKAILAK